MITTARADDFIALDVRLPRAPVAALTGLAFGLSGAMFRSLVRNPVRPLVGALLVLVPLALPLGGRSGCFSSKTPYGAESR